MTEEPFRTDSAGTRAAPCAGRQVSPEGECATCGHLTADHDRFLVCGRCHELCGYCGQFYDQHTDSEWRSCRIDLAADDEVTP